MKIVIPTANRPASLRAVLDYYGRFYPRAELVVADGSTAEAKELNQQAVGEAQVAVDYQPYDEDLPVFERLLRALSSIDRQFVIMGADDNYPVLETLEKARKRLIEKPEAMCAGGHLVHLDVTGPGRASARLDVVRHINADNPAQRMRVFGSLPFPTSYGVARREHVIARLEFLKSWYFRSFYELGVGLIDVAAGQYFAIPEVGFVCTSNYVDDRPSVDEPLAYLRGADQVLAMHDAALEHASRAPGFDEAQVRDVLSSVIGRRTAALAGAPTHQVVGFVDKAPYKTPMVDNARQLFADLFTEGTAARAQHADRFAFIAERIQQITTSSANLAQAGLR
ncbi:TIGR00180 family glycosyltransferase [Nocardioides humilatus]|uniref:TIGR00180 family glycosyltransferase n=1 Tax=Nocardioides humilatus TaxID=2607660 RepID=A0A5B1LNK4_9ACTN|nr:TIGR00180 family glycosyltransferase [Nocardioides humilatus]KAA1421219.1 TIGR00180 family glycosyltransferase [Nocardioides humilatus]